MRIVRTVKSNSIPTQYAFVALASLLACSGRVTGGEATPEGGDGVGLQDAAQEVLDASTICDQSKAERLRFGLNIDPANPGGLPSADVLKELGVRWVRVEWKNSVDPQVQDVQIAALHDAGIRVLLIIDYASAWQSPGELGNDAAWVDYLENQFYPRVSELAAHYEDRVDAWEIWNESDLKPTWVPATFFGQMVAESSARIRMHSTRPIVLGGLASGNPGYLQEAINAVPALGVDAIGVHPYGQAALDDWPHPGWGFGNMSTLIQSYADVAGLPIWLTEIGSNDHKDEMLAQYLRNVYELTASLGETVPVVLWFCWSDAMVDSFGLTEANGQGKLSHAAYEETSPAWEANCDGI